MPLIVININFRGVSAEFVPKWKPSPDGLLTPPVSTASSTSPTKTNRPLATNQLPSCEIACLRLK